MESGGLDTTQRATKIWQKILEEFEPPPIDPAINEEMLAYIAKRKEALGKNEPQLEPQWL